MSAKASAKADEILMKEKGKYEPAITVSTKKIWNNIEIWVKDNSIGIQEMTRTKTFRPFLPPNLRTLTGLGLSLGYDIVKAHGRELRVESKEGEGLFLK